MRTLVVTGLSAIKNRAAIKDLLEQSRYLTFLDAKRAVYRPFAEAIESRFAILGFKLS